MKYNVDIHVVLSTFEDMDDFHDDPDEASERLNFILHALRHTKHNQKVVKS